MTGTGARAWENRFPRTAEGIEALLARCDHGTAVASRPAPRRGCRRGGGVGDLRMRSGQDEAQSGLCGEDRPAGRPPVGGCAAAGQCGGDLLSPLAIRELRNFVAAAMRWCRRAPAWLIGCVRSCCGRESSRPLANTVSVTRGWRRWGCRRGPSRVSRPCAACSRWSAPKRPRRPRGAVRGGGGSDRRSAAAITGVGPVLGLMIRAEVGDISRFRRRVIWPVTPGWSRASTPTPGVCATGASRGVARRGCGGR